MLAVGPQAVWLLLEQRRRRATLIVVAVVAACGAALIPLAVAQNGTRRDAWIGHSPLGIRLRQILPQLLIGTGSPDRLTVKFVAFGAALIALGLLALRSTRAERSAGLAAAALALSGFALTLAFMVVGYDDLITRNLLALIIPAGIVLACGLGARHAGWLGFSSPRSSAGSA